MKILLFLTLFLVGTDALFGFGESKTTQGPKISLGREIGIPHTDEDSDTGEIVIPFNDPSTTTRKPTTTVPRINVGGIGMGRSTVDVRGFTSTMNPRFTAATKRLPSSDRHPSSGCPNRIDAYTFGPEYDYAFYESNVYKLSNNRIVDRSSLDEEFPDGPHQVNGALYDSEREILWLVAERSVYGYKQASGAWKLQSVFPKELPSSVGFTPDAAIRWHNKHQVLLSNGGKFALYDEYWNKSLMTGRTDSYFENLPDRVRGISTWNSQGNANVFTQSLVFVYNSEAKKVTGDGVPLGDFWRC
uniref:SCP domain-containing protein n=1 Tax=Caenorhabditis tropicalis TaxID=1561998 RepID=A0A1I7V2W8_9PELO